MSMLMEQKQILSQSQSWIYEYWLCPLSLISLSFSSLFNLAMLALALSLCLTFSSNDQRPVLTFCLSSLFSFSPNLHSFLNQARFYQSTAMYFLLSRCCWVNSCYSNISSLWYFYYSEMGFGSRLRVKLWFCCMILTVNYRAEWSIILRLYKLVERYQNMWLSELKQSEALLGSDEVQYSQQMFKSRSLELKDITNTSVLRSQLTISRLVAEQRYRSFMFLIEEECMWWEEDRLVLWGEWFMKTDLFGVGCDSFISRCQNFWSQVICNSTRYHKVICTRQDNQPFKINVL